MLSEDDIIRYNDTGYRGFNFNTTIKNHYEEAKKKVKNVERVILKLVSEKPYVLAHQLSWKKKAVAFLSLDL